MATLTATELLISELIESTNFSSTWIDETDFIKSKIALFLWEKSRQLQPISSTQNPDSKYSTIDLYLIKDDRIDNGSDNQDEIYFVVETGQPDNFYFKNSDKDEILRIFSIL